VKLTFSYTILYVESVADTIAFYEKAFGFSRRFLSPDESYGELETGATTLSFAKWDLAESNLKDGFTPSNPAGKPFGMEIGLCTPEVQNAVDQALAAGAVLEAAPKTKPWGQTVAYVRDLNGFLVEICTPMG